MLTVAQGVLLWVLAVSGAALALYWIVGLFRIAETVVRLPTARAGLRLAPAPESVCVVIPAHNEARAIASLVHSLRAQDHPRVRVVLALDRCTDGTPAVARAAIGPDQRFEIVEIDACPDDWAGKVHAVWTAMQRSAHAHDAEYLLFADADTVFHPGCVRATTALLRARGLDLLSLMSTLTSDRWFERLVQPAAATELMHQYPPVRASRDAHRRAFANGQFMLFRASAYRQIGGHERVKDHLLEDLALAREIAGANLRAAVLLADGMLICRMYETWAEFRKGWKRIYTEGANRKPSRLRAAMARVLVTNVALPVLTLAGLACSLTLSRGVAPRVALFTCSIGGALWLLGVLWVYLLNRAPLWAAPFHPLGAALTAGVLADAASDLLHRRATEWGGRSYVREAR